VPRRAGVSSFGVGGTNAHVIVEEAPKREERPSKRPHHVLTISARSETALNQAWRQLAAHVRTYPEVDLADVAFTLHLGRHFFKHRRALVVDGERPRLLESLDAADKLPAVVAAAERPAVFFQ